MADEADRTPNAGLGPLLETRGLRRLWLHSLGRSDVEGVVGSMVSLGVEDRHALATMLFDDTRGLAHHVCAVIAALVDDHLLTVDQDGKWRVSPALAGRPLPVPVSVRDRVRAILDRLTPEATAVAGAAAVLGAPTAPAVIEDVAEVSPDATEVALAQLVEHGLLRQTEGQEENFELASPLIGRAMAAVIPPTKRRALHARAAEVLVKRDLAATAERSLLPYHLARAETPPVRVSTASAKPAWTRRAMMAAAAVVAVGTIVAARMDLVRSPFRSADGVDSASGVPVVALGRIADYREAGAANLTKPLIDMLATNLGRVAGMRVVSTARMYELVSQGRGGTDSSAAVVGAARRAGATELVDGALYTLAGGGMRLDLRRVELATGNMRKSHSVNGKSLFELADSGTARLAADFGAMTPAGSVADVTTRSLAAYRLYEEGLRAFYQNERASAQQLFDAALIEDSTFAMAAYYAALTRRDNFREIAPHFQRALRLVNRTSERERLTILAQWALLTSSPTLSTYADSLVLRYPQDVEGHLFSGQGLFKLARYPEAIRALERAVVMDSSSVAGGNPRCSACDALEYLTRAYRSTDDYAGAERVARRWIRMQPRSAQAWEQLHAVLAALGRNDEALAALRRRASLSPTVVSRESVIGAQLHLMAGNFAETERLLGAYITSTADTARLADATWYVVMLLRQQGRLRDAAEAAKRYRQLMRPLRDTAPEMWVPEAQVLFESGRYRAAAALFDTVATWESKARLTANQARARVWRLTHVATARAAAGDTASLMRLADTLRVVGTGSGDARDQRLHHYIRGLVLVARGQDEDALAELALASSSPSEGYTRINLEMGKAAMRRGHPRDALNAVQPALRGLIEGAGYYTTRTELHEIAAHAFEALGTRDSAMVHYDFVVRAWGNADPQFQGRLAEARQKLEALRRR
jgi:tetratricopeptide (TPR) repeat protein